MRNEMGGASLGNGSTDGVSSSTGASGSVGRLGRGSCSIWLGNSLSGLLLSGRLGSVWAWTGQMRMPGTIESGNRYLKMLSIDVVCGQPSELG